MLDSTSLQGCSYGFFHERSNKIAFMTASGMKERLLTSVEAMALEFALLMVKPPYLRSKLFHYENWPVEQQDRCQVLPNWKDALPPNLRKVMTDAKLKDPYVFTRPRESNAKADYSSNCSAIHNESFSSGSGWLE
jgi:hypothetical protein